MKKYRYFLQPIGEAANEAIAMYLNQQGKSAITFETQSIEVAGKRVPGVYLAPDHSLLTVVGHSVHKANVRVYVQEGEGEIRPYVHFKSIGQKLAKTKAVKAAKAAVAKLKT